MNDEPGSITRTMTPAARKQRQLAPLKTGLYVRATSGKRLRDRKVGRLVHRMREAMPWLTDADEPAARAWAQLEVLGGEVYAELRTGGVVNGEGEARRLLGDFRMLRQTQLAYGAALGMTPAARMGLRVDDSRARSLDVAAELAELHRERTERESTDVTQRAESMPNRADDGA